LSFSYLQEKSCPIKTANAVMEEQVLLNDCQSPKQ